MTVRLEKLIQTLNEYDNEYTEGECIACKLFHQFFSESSFIRDIENSLLSLKETTLGNNQKLSEGHGGG